MSNHLKACVGVSFAVLACLVVVVIETGIARAASTAEEEIHACVHKKSGRLRIVSDLDECKRSEEPISWSLEGDFEPPGTSSQIIHETTDVPTSEANRNFFFASALCPSGMSATGGGFRVNADGIYPKASQPFPSSSGDPIPIGWHAAFAYLPDVPNPPPSSAEVTVWVVCTWAP